jgi:hypothetical protein
MNEDSKRTYEQTAQNKTGSGSFWRNCNMMGASPAALPAAWVLIPAKGQSFQMGQQFSGKRWTYAFSAHQVSFTYKTSPSFA